MPTVPNHIKDIFGERGSLSKSLDHFEFRSSQLQMAGVIRDALREKVPAIIEAGTGTGKTFGYLVPVMLSGKKCVISTGTKNLQEQIFFKDIPLISKSTGLQVDSMLMKGRKNYLCLHRYHQFFSIPSVLDPVKIETGKRIEQWVKVTEFADRAELTWLSDDDPLWDNLTCTSDQCLGSDCFHMEECYLNRLRKRAARAEIIIVNHHLFFADIIVKKGGFGEIIPRFEVAVFDEAHKIEEIATTYFGVSISTGQLIDFIKDAEEENKKSSEGDKKDTLNLLNRMRSPIEQMQRLFLEVDDKGRLNNDLLGKIREGPSGTIRECLHRLREKGSRSIASRADDLSQSIEKVFSVGDPNLLHWYEKRKKGIVFHSSPLDISDHLREFLYDKIKTIIFTSATLATDGSFTYIRSRLGIPESRAEGIYPSHFDYGRQTLMYIPEDMPSPNDPGFSDMVAKRIFEILEMTSGRALILFTSYLNLNKVHKHILGKIPYTIYKQGDAPRSALLEKFRQETHSVLLATGSFWQGIDVPGEALSCLIVDKLPFDSPGDPLVAARIESIRSQGGNPFIEYQLPAAIISLKQGLGRLIRKNSDRGVISILDSRIIKSRYGHFFFDSLPRIPVSHDLSDIRYFFEGPALDTEDSPSNDSSSDGIS